MPQRFRRTLLLGACLALLLLLAPLPFAFARWLQALENAAHVPLFGLLALLALTAMRTRRGAATLVPGDYARVWALVTTAGALTEVAQWLTGRDASMVDLANDALGAALVLSAVALWRREPFAATRRGTATAYAIISVTLALVIAPLIWTAAAYWQRSAQLPILWQYRSSLDRFFLWHPDSTIRRVPVAACLAEPAQGSEGEKAVLVSLGSDAYPGVMVDEPFPDWRGRRELSIDLINPGAEPLTLTVRVHDAAHDRRYADRYNAEFVLPAMQRTQLRIAISDIERAPAGRAMDMAHIAGIVIFRASPSPDAAFCLVSVRLR